MSSIDKNVRPTITPEMIETAIRRARLERSQAFWGLLQAIFGRRDANAGQEARPASASAASPIAAAGRC